MATGTTRNTTKTLPVRKPAAPKVVAKATPLKAAEKPQKKLKKEKKSSAKQKVVRDSFTMPQNDYALIATLKEKALASGVQMKKSELLRAGLHLLAKSSLAQLKKSVADLEAIKTGRPKKS